MALPEAAGATAKICGPNHTPLESIDMLFSGGEDWARRSWPRQLPLRGVPCHAQRKPALACEDPAPSPSRPHFEVIRLEVAPTLLLEIKIELDGRWCEGSHL